MKLCIVSVFLIAAALVVAPTEVLAQVFVEDFESGSLDAWELNKSGFIVEDPLVPGNNVVSFAAANNTFDLRSFELPLLASMEYRISFRYLGLGTPGSAPDNFGGALAIAAQGIGTTGYTWDTTPCQLTYLGDLIDDGAWHVYDLVFQRSDFTSDRSAQFYIVVEDWDGAASACPPNATVGDVFFDDIMVEPYGAVPNVTDSWGALKARY